MASAGTAILALEKAAPKLTVRKGVQIIKTGIEYPLSTGPATFTPEDLADAVAAQNDPAIPCPRVWLGHFDDTRIHGIRLNRPPSGEPAVGLVKDMVLTEQGHCVVGDLHSIPIWLNNILAVAFPSRSIEGRFNFHTPSGNKWRLAITELALLGVVWPGVGSLDDIASLYTEAGPAGVEVTSASEEQPVTVAAISTRQITANLTAEDVRRKFYDWVKSDPAKNWWWIRSMYVDPLELIVDDDNGGLHRVPFTTKDDDVEWGDPTDVKIKYVNASHGGIEAEPVNQNRTAIAHFRSKSESRPQQQEGALNVKLPTRNSINVSIKKGASS